MARLWRWLSTGLGIASSMLVAALLYVSRQRDRAEHRAGNAEHRADSTDRARETDRRIDERRAEAREQSAETQREAEERPAGTRPSGHFRR